MRKFIICFLFLYSSLVQSYTKEELQGMSRLEIFKAWLIAEKKAKRYEEIIKTYHKKELEYIKKLEKSKESKYNYFNYWVEGYYKTNVKLNGVGGNVGMMFGFYNVYIFGEFEYFYLDKHNVNTKIGLKYFE